MGQCSSKQNALRQQAKEQIHEQMKEKLLRSIETGDLCAVRDLTDSLGIVGPKVNETITPQNGKYKVIPWHYACKKGQIEIAQYFVNTHKADVDAQDYMGWTAMHHACDQGRLDIVRWLVQHENAAVQIPDQDGEPPLHKLKSTFVGSNTDKEAVLHDRLAILRLLVEVGGADPSATNHEGDTFLDLIEQVQNNKICKVLPSWITRETSGLDSYADFVEQDYEVQSASGSSLACSALTLSRYHIDNESDAEDFAGNWYGLDEEMEEESEAPAQTTTTIVDWINYLQPLMLHKSDTFTADKAPLTPTTSLEEGDSMDDVELPPPTFSFEI